MSINALFSTASSSLAAQRVALDVTGENIANVNTDGYSRQRVIMETAMPTTHNAFQLASGVSVATIQRMYDSVLNKQVNDSTSLLGNNESKLKTLQQLEPYLNELSGNSIGDALQGLSDAWQSLSLNPSGISERQTVLGRAQIVTDTFHQVSTGIINAQAFADLSLGATTTGISSAAREIADLNSQIRITEQVSGSANELRDRRDMLIEKMAKQVGITYTEQPDGMVNINLLGGEALVTGEQYATLYTNPVGTAVTSNELRITAIGHPPPAVDPLGDVNVTATIGGSNNSMGEIGGLLYMRDTATPDYLSKLDELAYNLAYQVNTVHAGGWNLNNATNVRFFSPVTASLPPASPATYAGYSMSISVAVTGVNEIAAADTNPLVGGVGNNKNALLLAGLSNTAVAFNGNVKTTTSEFYNSLVAGVGVDVRAAQNLTTQNEAFVRQLNTLRDSNSGVSLDEELTNLIKYQKAFEGASKVISTASQMLDTVMGLIR